MNPLFRCFSHISVFSVAAVFSMIRNEKFVTLISFCMILVLLCIGLIILKSNKVEKNVTFHPDEMLGEF